MQLIFISEHLKKRLKLQQQYECYKTKTTLFTQQVAFNIQTPQCKSCDVRVKL